MARPKSDIDARILHAARARFLLEGVEGASLRAIAKDAGTSIGMVYYYFSSKDDLFLAVVEEVYARLLADFAQALAPDVDVPLRVERLYARVGALGNDELEVLRLVLREALVSSARLERILERFRRDQLPLMLRTISDGVNDGALEGRHHPLLLLGSMLAMGAFPPVLRPLLDDQVPGAPEGRDLARQLVGLLMSGVGRGSSAERPARVSASPAE